MKDVRIAAVVSNSRAGNNRRNLDNMFKWINVAQEKNASIICFPEMNISGYAVNRYEMLESETVPGPSSRALSEIARRTDMIILAGLAEKDEHGKIFATHLVIKPAKEIERYRKVHIPPPELDIFTPADTVPLFNAPDLKFGLQLCYDTHFPEMTTRMAVNGADLIFMPHASPRKSPEEKLNSWLRHLTARAYDNSIFIIACNQTGDNGHGLHFPGVAVAIGPSGKISGTYLSNQEGLLICDLKSREMEEVRNNRMHFFLPHRRPDVYGFY